jgi:hypothetical protein
VRHVFKSHVKNILKETATKICQIGELVVSDVWGPAQVTGINKYWYFFSFTDAATCHTIVYFLDQKSNAPKFV